MQELLSKTLLVNTDLYCVTAEGVPYWNETDANLTDRERELLELRSAIVYDTYYGERYATAAMNELPRGSSLSRRPRPAGFHNSRKPTLVRCGEAPAKIGNFANKTGGSPGTPLIPFNLRQKRRKTGERFLRSQAPPSAWAPGGAFIGEWGRLRPIGARS